jgi:hypothetical protein
MWSERSFSFVLGEHDFEHMRAAIGVLLWPGEYTDNEVAGAKDVIDSVRTGTGVFRIVDSETTPSSDEYPLGRIERIEFELDVCRPG